MRYSPILAVIGLLIPCAIGQATNVAELPRLPASHLQQPRTDWLIDPSPFEAGVYRGDRTDEIILSNGLIRRRFRLSPNAATIAFDNVVTGQAIIRGVKPEALVEIDGASYEVGGLKGQPDYAFLTPEWADSLEADPKAPRFTGFTVGETKERFPWKRVRHHAPGVKWPPPGVSLRMDYSLPGSGIRVAVHYELYDGIPALCKWITVNNGTNRVITVNRFTSEILAAVEYATAVEFTGLAYRTPNIHVETDMAFGGFTQANANIRNVHWETDPDYKTQVSYRRLNPCLLKVSPDLGPDQRIEPGGTFESFRAFVLPYDSYDRERQGLALRRMYRTVAPWVTENPLMMHVRWSDWKSVKRAIDQCADVGFEMVILTFGSGFDIENDRPDYLAKMKRYADYAAGKGIEIGGYSLLASRTIGGGNNVVMPAGKKPRFNHSPCLGSVWAKTYFAKLYNFFEQTGFRLLEHDGSYPGDECIATTHPGHRGRADSRWAQWRVISDFYKYCRAHGVYLNVPDFYYLTGSSKCGMGYRESNWSLPRAQQVIHTRQNIYDGTWEKTPSMGWMFVPLTEYHGGGATATIEPLDEHRDHYERMLYSNLAMGVQAAYRGPRLYDTSRTRDLVAQWVTWFKKHRDILESDVVHGRRADGRDIDWMLHVNPNLAQRGMVVVFNPLRRAVKKKIRVNLYYTGLTETAVIREQEGEPKTYVINRRDEVELPVEVGPESMTWFTISGQESRSR